MSSNPFLRLAGAVAAPWPDEGAVWHYGNPLGEQRALERGDAIVDLSSRGVIAVPGPDRLSWLNSITSQELLGLAPGESTELLVLDPTGRIEWAAKVVDDGATAWLIVDRPEVDGLLGFLTKMRFMLRVEPRDATGEYAVIGSSIPLTDWIAQRSGGDHEIVAEWHDPWSHVTAGGHQYALGEHPAAQWSWYESIVSPDEQQRLAESGAPLAGTAALEALRIAAWRPRAAAEVDERSIPHELDWLRSAVHLSKGCYRGQETVAKVHNLGHPPRRLVMLHLDGSDAVLPAHGDPVLLGGDPVGLITSAAIHHELGPIALAVVKRSTPTDAVLMVRAEGGDVAAAQEVIVPPGAGATADVPRLPRLGARTR
ncbi:glycine cleavage T C-terminal barrel domain-containing protein [Gryllotalpicola sp.]|uniref:CAF17-like 4Fe-4S cluster assembly/insertion protein YgfZ n=1 Tax=Gryllotalpicola sp. TaxID=1932787 RepID=UPI0026338544|nr:glycine cleavage T C-terminal barrel domain-containing protein [Gryllotalpicola sp.]